MKANEIELKNTKQILEAVFEVLNSAPVQEKFGEFFAAMSPEEKTDFVLDLVADLASENPFIMGALVEDMVNFKEQLD